MTIRKHFLALAGAVVLIASSSVNAMDVAGYRATAKEIIQEALSGKIADVDATIAKLDKLMVIGIAGCKEYAAMAPEHAKLMNLVVDNADAMKKMTLDEIEPAWHDGEFINQHGFDFDSIEHFGPALSHMDSVLHPATAIIALNDYKKSGDGALLTQVKDELGEVLEHLDHVE